LQSTRRKYEDLALQIKEFLEEYEQFTGGPRSNTGAVLHHGRLANHLLELVWNMCLEQLWKRASSIRGEPSQEVQCGIMLLKDTRRIGDTELRHYKSLSNRVDGEHDANLRIRTRPPTTYTPLPPPISKGVYQASFPLSVRNGMVTVCD
jgi:hypothetical protein